MTAQIPVYNDPAAGTTPQPEEKGYPDVLLHFIREGKRIEYHTPSSSSPTDAITEQVLLFRNVKFANILVMGK